MAWKEFRRGKCKKHDVQLFERNLEDNLFALREELASKAYRHGGYASFYITDPKLRQIHKASVRDRIVHHAVYRVLYSIFDRSFIFDSYSCRLNKGTHRAVFRLEKFARQVSRNYTGPCFVLKCDIKKFFDSIDHRILLEIIARKIRDRDILWLVVEIIASFSRERESKSTDRRGLPLGNLTSQLFANVCLNGFDQFVKHKLRIKHYIRYCDDFVVLGDDERELCRLIVPISGFLEDDLGLKLHKSKVTIRKLKQGMDFLGYVALPYHRVLRTKTKRRMLKRLNASNLPSYLGLLKHCHSRQLAEIAKLKIQCKLENDN